MRNFLKVTGLIAGLIILIYGAGFLFYNNRFHANTYLGSVNVSHMSLADAQKAVEDKLHAQSIQLTEGGQAMADLQLAELTQDFDAQSALKDLVSKQAPIQWGMDFFETTRFDTSSMTASGLDEAALTQQLTSLGLLSDDRTPPTDAQLTYDASEGYHIQDAKVGTQVDVDRLAQGITLAVVDGQSQLAIKDFYSQPTITAEDPALNERLAKIKDFSDVKFTYTMAGEEVTIPQATIESWMIIADDGSISLDQDLVYAYVDQLDTDYASLYQEREFKSTNQGVVTVQPQIYGWSFDFDTEVSALIADIEKGEDVKRQPAYLGNVYGGDITQKDDIGDTHIEIDLSYQMLYYYIDGEVALSTAVVTGLPPLMDTIPGAWNILYKESPSVLKGFNIAYQKEYATPVTYWVPFDWGGMGLHDAWWQSSYGGNVYTYAGSNGCINIPPDTMAVLYDMVEPGLPVIIF